MIYRPAISTEGLRLVLKMFSAGNFCNDKDSLVPKNALVLEIHFSTNSNLVSVSVSTA